MTLNDAHEQIHVAGTSYLFSRQALYMDDNFCPQVVADGSEKAQAIDDKYDNALRSIFCSLSYADQIQISVDYDKEVFNLMLDDTQRTARGLMK